MGSRQIVLVSTAGFSVLNTGIFWWEAKTKRLFHSASSNHFTPLPPTTRGPVSKLSLFLSLSYCRVVEKPNHTPARNPGTLYIIQYSLIYRMGGIATT